MEHCGLAPTLSTRKKALDFRATHLDKQPSLSYCLPMVETAEDILKDLDGKISSPNLGVCSKKVTKLLPYTSIRGRQCYHFEDNTMCITRTSSSRPLPHPWKGTHSIQTPYLGSGGLDLHRLSQVCLPGAGSSSRHYHQAFMVFSVWLLRHMKSQTQDTRDNTTTEVPDSCPSPSNVPLHPGTHGTSQSCPDHPEACPLPHITLAIWCSALYMIVIFFFFFFIWPPILYVFFWAFSFRSCPFSQGEPL